MFCRESTAVPGADSFSQSQMEDEMFESKKQKSVKRVIYNLNSDEEDEEEEEEEEDEEEEEEHEEKGEDDDDDEDDDDYQVRDY